MADPDPAVRAWAATASTLDNDPNALVEIRLALRDPHAVITWLDGRGPESAGPLLPTLVAALELDRRLQQAR